MSGPRRKAAMLFILVTVLVDMVSVGLIIPVYAYATGGGFGGYGYAVLRGGLRLLGAVSGGFYADSWYLSGQAPTVSLPK